VTRVAVTGAAGFVGAAVVARLLADDAEVVAIVRPGGDPSRLAAGVDTLEVDLEDEDGAARAIAALEPELCVHLAAAGAVVRERDHERLLRLNAIFPAALARALAAAGCRRLVTAGSSSEYGPVAGPMSEERAPVPDDLYGAAKLAGGLLARAAGLELGLETAHLRLFSVYGPGEDPRRLIASVARALLERRPIDLTPGDQVRDFVYVDDVAEALVAAATGPLPSGAIVNVGSGCQTTVREACLLLATAAGADPALLRFGARPYRARERFSWQADTSYAETALRWRARTTLEQGLALTVESVRAGMEVAA
jgi:UDP-glucose 4-epimerase